MIDTKLISILSKYDLKYIETISENNRNIILKVSNNAGEFYTVKTVKNTNPLVINRFLSEIDNTITVRKYIKPSLRKYILNLKYYSKDSDNPYLIYKHIEGRNLSGIISDYGLNFGVFTEGTYKYFISTINNLSLVPLNKVPFNWGKKSILKEINKYINDEQVLDVIDYGAELKDFIYNNIDNTLKYLTVSQRDLYPENFIKALDRKLYFIDFEYLSKVPVGYNAAFLYLLFWREDFWRSKTYSEFLNFYYQNSKLSYTVSSKRFNMSFRFCICILGLRFIYQISKYADRTNIDYKNCIGAFYHYIRLALSGDIVSPINVKFSIIKNDLVKVLNLYSIEGKIIDYKIFYASQGNTVIKVNTKNSKYILRFYSSNRDISTIKNELKIINEVKSEKIKTYNIVLNKNSQAITKIRLYGRTRNLVIFEYIEGKKLSRKYANRRNIYKLGRLLRNIHDKNVTHGDFSKENILFSKSKITGIIDFEWGIKTRSRTFKFLDLSKAIALWIVDIREKALADETFILYFLKGYYDYTPIGDELKNICQSIITFIKNERSLHYNPNNPKNIKRFNNSLKVVNGILKKAYLEDIKRH